METPFTLGEVKWKAVGHPVEVVHRCPVCDGTAVATLVCANGESFEVECEGCDRSTYSTRMGTIRQWELTPKAECFVVADVKSMHNGEWHVTQGYGDAVPYTSLYATEAEALAAATADADRHTEHNMMFRANSRKRVGKAAWTVRYGKDEIRKAEATIAWHTARMHQKRKETA